MSRIPCILLCLLAMQAQAQAEDWHPHEAIQAAAAAQARLKWSVSGGRVDAVADTLDARVRLARCETPLQASVPFDSRRTNRVTVEVRCAGPRPWKIFVPVRLAVFQPVLVAARALPRDSYLAAEDIEIREADTGRLDYGYLVRLDDAVGQRLRRPLSAGEPITPGNLETPAMVLRGQQVVLEARSGGLTVRMAGVAQADGIRGQVIPVENLRSGRRVQAVVRSAKSVEVLLR